MTLSMNSGTCLKQLKFEEAERFDRSEGESSAKVTL
jgi:hypothetical protein